MFESYCASRPTPQAAALVDRICAASRAENRAAAEQRVAIGELFAHLRGRFAAKSCSRSSFTVRNVHC